MATFKHSVYVIIPCSCTPFIITSIRLFIPIIVSLWHVREAGTHWRCESQTGILVSHASTYIPPRPGSCLLEEVVNERVSYWLHSWLPIKNWIAIRYQWGKVKVHSTRFLFILFYYFCLWRGNLREAKWRTYRKKRFSWWCACQTHKLLISLLALYGSVLWWFMLFIFFR